MKETLHLIKDIYNYSYLINEKIKYDNYKREVNSYIMFFFFKIERKLCIKKFLGKDK